MTESTQLTPPPRFGYIRTTSHPEKTREEIFTFLTSYPIPLSPNAIRQASPSPLEIKTPRHHFCFGAANVSDSHILDVLITSIKSRTPAEASSEALFRYVCRSDLELRMSNSRVGTMAGQKVLRRCAKEGIPTKISGADDLECDDSMLKESHYLIDFITKEFHTPIDSWFQNQARAGIPQDNIFTNPSYDISKSYHERDRLRLGYAGYGWKASSGGYHGNGSYHCRYCGGKCKRNSKCKGQPKPERLEEMNDWEERHEKWKNENLRLPGPRSEQWKDLTADLICWRYMMQDLGKYGVKEKWKSIDTFSGD